MADVLARICEQKREWVAQRRRVLPLAEVRRELAFAPAPRGFAGRLEGAVAGGRFGLIAEIKRSSPSKGLIRADFDPPALARAYEDGGAACLSVLTEAPHFQGADEYLTAARAAVSLPVLRKDFMVDLYQIDESRLLGADCVLLILAALEDGLAREMAERSAELGMDALAEVHDEGELERALRLPVRLIGINNRNLKTLGVDLATTERLAPRVPADRTVVCESGLARREDLERMAGVGVRCFLIGESLMRHADVAAATRTMVGAPAP